MTWKCMNIATWLKLQKVTPWRDLTDMKRKHFWPNLKTKEMTCHLTMKETTRDSNSEASNDLRFGFDLEEGLTWLDL